MKNKKNFNSIVKIWSPVWKNLEFSLEETFGPESKKNDWSS